MMKISFWVAATVVMLCWTGLVSAQTLREMEVMDHGMAAVVVRNPDVGILIVESVIPELSFESNMGIIKVEHDKPGEWILHLYPGTNLITFKAEGYKTVSDVRLVVPKKRARKVEVKPLKIVGTEIPIAILTKPEGAEIFIDHESRGTGKGHTVSVGTHRLRIVKDGYRPIEETIDVDEKHTIFEYTLEKIEDVGLEITTEPDSATIYIDGVKVGLSPVGTFYLPGKYPIRIERAWYVAYEDSIEIKEPETKKEYVLQPDFGEITVTSSPQSNLDIYINGIDQHVKTPHTFFRQRPGTYNIQARSQYYETEEREIALKRGEKKRVRLTSEENFATLTIHTYDSATVLLNGERIERLTDIRLEPMMATIEVRMLKAEPLTERIALRKGERRSVDLYPEVQTGSIQVTVKPLDAKVELKGDAGEYYTSEGKGYFKDIPILGGMN